ncbi:MAG: PQQ-binding-like beta-propeller repeat protein [Planctomycetota bacterium]
MPNGWLNHIIVAGAGLLAGITVTGWLMGTPVEQVDRRVPVERSRPETKAGSGEERNPGTLIRGDGEPSDIPGTWPQFRGPDRTNIAADGTELARSWPSGGLKELWQKEIGAGHAGVAVRNGRVYVNDYAQEDNERAIRCLSLADGSEIWRYTYSVSVKRNHGVTRTVPSVNDEYVVSMGPKCHVLCLDAKTGEEQWKMDLVDEFGTTVPPWYAGQCPLLQGDSVILAPGADPLMMKVSLAGGEVAWKTPNPGGWEMTHSSVVSMEYNGSKQYVYSTTRGVVGVSADDGKLLWKFPDWTIKIATVPSPLPVGDGRIFLSGGYESGAMMIRLAGEGTNIEVETVFDLEPKTFGAEQHTPVLYGDHIYGIIPSGQIACLSLEGEQLWTSSSDTPFGLGPFMVADGTILALQAQEGVLHMAEAAPDGYSQLATAKVLDGHDAWAPMALAGGRLLVRDLDTLVCLELPGPGQ